VAISPKKVAISPGFCFPNGTNVCFHGFLWSSPSACLPVCLRPGGRGGPQTNWKASGRFLFVWLRRRRRPRDTVQIVVFVGGPLLETIVPYEIPTTKSNQITFRNNCAVWKAFIPDENPLLKSFFFGPPEKLQRPLFQVNLDVRFVFYFLCFFLIHKTAVFARPHGGAVSRKKK